MKSISKKIIVIVFILLLVFGTFSFAFAQDEENQQIELSGLADKVKGGVIDWSNQWMYAVGEGAVPPKSKVANRAVARLKARDYAKMEAIAHLLMLIEGTAISYEGVGKDYMADVTLRQKIEGYVKNVSIIKTEYVEMEGGTIAVVTVGTPMYGQSNGGETPGTIFLGKMAEVGQASAGQKTKAVPLIELPVDVPGKNPNPVSSQKRSSVGSALLYEPGVKYSPIWIEKNGVASARPVEPGQETPVIKQEGPFTSVIIDTRGYDILRAISPKIRKLDGSEVWGTITVNADYAINEGIATYAKDMDKAKASSRCGNNPLVIKAVGRAGGKAMCDTIISDADAKWILDENKKTKFMDNFKVIFVTDPSKATAVSVK